MKNKLILLIAIWLALEDEDQPAPGPRKLLRRLRSTFLRHK